jgi:hypothetical protein
LLLYIFLVPFEIEMKKIKSKVPVATIFNLQD